MATLLALSAAGSALALDKLVKRDLDAFTTFVMVRAESLEAAIARRDVEEARALATRIHDEECRFLERVVRYLRDANNSGVASELESYLADFRQLSLKDSVRVRRQAGPGRVPLVELAHAALTGTRVSMSTFARPPPGAPPAGAPQAPAGPGPGLPAGPPPGFAPPPIGTPVPSLPSSITTARLTAPKAGSRAISILKADLSDEPLLASHRSKPVNLDVLRQRTGAGGPSIQVAPTLQPGSLEDDTVLASQIRRPTGSGATGSGAGARAPLASQIRVPSAVAPVAVPVGLRRGR